MSKPQLPLCAKCPVRACHPQGPVENTQVDMESAPPFCPMKLNTDALQKAAKEYRKESVGEFARQASRQESECYERIDGKIRTKIPRIEEIIQFARKVNYKKFGIAFCLGLANEAATLSKIYENNGFEVISVCCKVGGIDKEEIGIKPDEKIELPGSYEPMCNPIAQAEILNAENVDLAIILGLCVGHDTLFMQYCKRPMTTLAVKDRVLAHNPLGALYTSSSVYYGRLQNE
ncbi:MAG: DUF1847 domain-containing protein [Dehalococcoidia bacterium]